MAVPTKAGLQPLWFILCERGKACHAGMLAVLCHVSRRHQRHIVSKAGLRELCLARDAVGACSTVERHSHLNLLLDVIVSSSEGLLDA